MEAIRTGDIYDRLEELQIKLPDTKPAGGVYKTFCEFGDKLVYMSGVTSDGLIDLPYGKVGDAVTLEQGQAAARASAIKMLGELHGYLGDLNRIKRFVKLLGFIASDKEFYQQPVVLNGASQLLVDVFGDECGKAARSAVGVMSLPRNVSVEIEAIIELK